MSVATLKRCRRCGETKSPEEFYKHKGMRDGRKHVCRACDLARKRQWERDNPDKVAAQNKRNRVRHAEARRQWQINWRKEDPRRYRAHNAVQVALRSGRLIRPSTCEACGVDCVPDAHHEDYDKRLEVEWLCRKCHRGRCV